MGISEKPVIPAPPAENTPTQSPQPTPTPAQDVVTDVKSVESALQTKIKQFLSDVYTQNRFLFYTIIPLVGIVYLVIKYHDLLINFLIKDSKNILVDQQQTDANLQKQADATQQAADNLVDQANNPPSSGPVDPDWDQK